MRQGRKILCILLVLVMIASLSPVMEISVRAEDPPAEPYYFMGVNVSGSGIDSNDFQPAFSVKTALFSGEAPEASAYGISSPALMTTPFGSAITAPPSDGMTYYLCIRIQSAYSDTLPIDYETAYDPAVNFVSLDGYALEYYETYPYQDGAGTEIYYKAIKLPEYSITVDGGAAYTDPSFSASCSAAYAGAVIYLSPEVPVGQIVTGWTATPETVTVSAEGFFTMPAEAVTLTPILEDQAEYSVTVNDDGSGTGSADPAVAAEGAEVTLNASPADGFRLKEWEVVSGGVTIENDKFTMGTENVVVNACFEPIPMHTVTVNDDGSGTGSTDLAVAAEGAEVTLSASPADGFRLKEWEVVSGGVTVENGKFTMNTENVVIKASFEHLPTCTVTVNDDGSGTGSADPAAAAEGAEVTLSALPDTGFRFKEWEIVSGDVSIENDTFIMGTENVVVKARFEPIPSYSITVTGGEARSYEGGILGDEAITEAREGSAVYLLPDNSLTPEGKYVSRWITTGVSVPIGYFNFTMPANDVTATPYYADRQSRTYSLLTGSCVCTAEGDSDSVIGLVQDGLVDADQPNVHTWDLYNTPVKLDLDKNGSWDLSFAQVDGEWVYTVLESNSYGDPMAIFDLTGYYWIKTVTFIFETPEYYPLWVNGVQVNSYNKSNILRNQGNPSAVYDPDSKTLTLNDPAFDYCMNGAYIYGREANSTLTVTGSAVMPAGDEYGIYVAGSNQNLQLVGLNLASVSAGYGVIVAHGSLNISSSSISATSTGASLSSDYYRGSCIIVHESVTISGSYLNLNGSSCGLIAAPYGWYGSTGSGQITISDSNVTSVSSQIGLYSTSNINIVSGTVYGEGGYYGIYGVSVSIGSAITKVSGDGPYGAIRAGTAGSSTITLTLGEGLVIRTPDPGEVKLTDTYFSCVCAQGEDSPAAFAVIVPSSDSFDTYPVWVGGIQVDEDNMNNVLHDVGAVTASYDPANDTLTLNSPTLSGTYENALIYTEKDGGTLTVKGTAALSSDSGNGIVANGSGRNLVLDGADLTVGCAGFGIRATDGSIRITSGSLDASGGQAGISAGNEVDIVSGTVSGTGTGTGSVGIRCGALSVGGGINSVTGQGGYAGVLFGGNDSDFTLGNGLVVAQPDPSGILSVDDASATVCAEGSSVPASKVVIVPGVFSVSVSSSGHGSASADPVSGPYGMEVSLSAEPENGYRFVEWLVLSGGVTVSDDRFTIGNASVKISAVFEAIPVYSVTVNTEGQGTAVADPVSGVEGTEVTLTAEAAEGYVFKEWAVVSGGVTVSDGKFTIGSADVVVKAVFEPLPVYYTVVYGDNSTWVNYTFVTVDLTVRRNIDNESCFSHFKGVKIDGRPLTIGKDYAASSGSTVVTLHAAAMEDLDAGNHTVTFLFDDGSVDATLIVVEGTRRSHAQTGYSPQTGDFRHSGLWLGMMLSSALSMCAVVIIEEKRRQRKKR